MKHLKQIETASKAVQNRYLTVYGIKNENKIIIKGAKVVPEGYVDLGLPSGKLWAKCNVGATKETDYGKYFQWGDTVGYEGHEAKTHSTWATAPFNNGSSSYDSSYFTANSGTWLTEKAELKPEYDAAYQATNGQAHMPTREDFEELKANTTVTWETNFNDSGINGRKFTSKSDSTKYIFIPAAGYAENGSFQYQGSDGNVWSSSFNSSLPSNALRLNFHSGSLGIYLNNRCNGFSVRGVLE